VKKLLLVVAGSFVGVFALVGGLLFYAFSHATLEGPGVEAAIVHLNADARATAVLGAPIVAGEGARGGTWSHGAHHKLDARLPVSGPRGAGVLDVVGFRIDGAWEYAVLELSVGAQRVDLR